MPLLNLEQNTLTTIAREGGEILLNACGQVIEMNDAVGRHFEFGYDPIDGVLNFVINESGTFFRTKNANGTYLDTWRGEGGSSWSGVISIDQNGYRFEGKSVVLCYFRDGTKVIDTLDADRQPIRREVIMPRAVTVAPVVTVVALPAQSLCA